VGVRLSGSAVGSIASLAGWLTHGGAVRLRHRALRALLARQGVIPADLADFLDHAHDHLLLLRSNDGYEFHHPLLRDHFADLEAAVRPDDGARWLIYAG
jgi:hypothetical protein